MVSQKSFKYIYGPVYSWRLGMSLGVDPLSTQKKVCNFDCLYCQLGRTGETYTERKEYVSVTDIMSEVQSLPMDVNIDYYTFSGRGEPTLARNLGKMIQALHDADKGKVAVLTNSALIDRGDVQEDLLLADFVLAKLDACHQHSLREVDNPAQDIQFQNIVQGIKSFKSKFKGKLALQIMFMPENMAYAKEIALIAKDINPHEIQINTPLRPSAATPLNEKELDQIKQYFKGLPAVTVYEREKKSYNPFDTKETIRRHGNFKA